VTSERGQYVDEDTDVVEWSGREIGGLLTRFIHVPEIAERIGQLRGTWPFNETSNCEATNTRDTDYRQLAEKGKISSSVYIT